MRELGNKTLRGVSEGGAERPIRLRHFPRYNAAVLPPPGVVIVSNNQYTAWPDLLIGLYDNLTGRRAEITYEFDNMHVKIPSGMGPSAEYAEWVLHGILKIRTRDTGTPPN